MFTPMPANREEFTSSLRQLADFLDANPDIPVPHAATILAVMRDTDEGGITDIFRMSIALGASFMERDGNYTTVRAFGPVFYGGYSTTADHLARDAAAASYYGSVIPDD